MAEQEYQIDYTFSVYEQNSRRVITNKSTFESPNDKEAMEFATKQLYLMQEGEMRRNSDGSSLTRITIENPVLFNINSGRKRRIGEIS